MIDNMMDLSVLHKTKVDECKPLNMRDNRISNLEDDLWCIHEYLDSRAIPREDEFGNVYSIVGRIKELENMFLEQMSAVEDYYLNNKQ